MTWYSFYNYAVVFFQGSDTWKDKDRFQKFAKASLELCTVYMEISSSTGSVKELFTAEMHLKNIIKQARYLFYSFWCFIVEKNQKRTLVFVCFGLARHPHLVIFFLIYYSYSQAQSFSDTEEFRNLQACLDEVKIKLESPSWSLVVRFYGICKFNLRFHLRSSYWLWSPHWTCCEAYKSDHAPSWFPSKDVNMLLSESVMSVLCIFVLCMIFDNSRLVLCMMNI